MGSVEKSRELRRKRARRTKLKKLRTRFNATQNETDRLAIATKAQLVSPLVDFVAEAAAAAESK